MSDGAGATPAAGDAPLVADPMASHGLRSEPTIAANVLPWYSGAFGVVLSDLPATGALSVRGPAGDMPILAQNRMLHSNGHTILLILQGEVPSAGASAYVLGVAGVEGTDCFPLRFERAPFDRTLATLTAQALAVTDGDAEPRRQWRPLSRYLQGVSQQAVRAELSLPIGDGFALVLDGDVDVGRRDAPLFALDGNVLTAATARLGTDLVTGRTIVLAPVVAARYFVLLDDVLVDLSCPLGATRSHLTRAPDAPFLRPSEAELVLDLVCEAEMEVSPRPADGLPLPNAVGWRNAVGGSLAVVGGLAVEAGTVLFITSDGREHELSRLLVRDVAHPTVPLLDAIQPIAAFHPDPDTKPERLHLVALLPRRLGAGSLHVSMSNAADAGGWVRLLDPADASTRSIVQAWVPPPPDDEAFLHLVAASVRASASRVPSVIVIDRPPGSTASSEATIVVLGLGAETDAIERTILSVAAAAHRGIPLLVVLSSSNHGFDTTVARLTTLSETSGIDIGVLALAGPVGATTALSVVFSRRATEIVVLFDAGTQVASDGWLTGVQHCQRSDGDTDLVVDAGGIPAAAVLSRSVGQRLAAAADGRLATFPATLHDFARVAGENGVTVVRVDGFETMPDAARAAAFEFRVDQVLLRERWSETANRGHA